MKQLICADTLTALKKLPADSIDLGITSPPYNKQENKKGWLVRNVVYEKASDKKEEKIYQEEQIQVLNQLFRITKSGSSFFYNHKIRWEKGELLHPMNWLMKTDWCVRQEIVWDRNLAANIRGWRFWQIEERIYWLYKPLKDNKIGKELQSKHAKLTSIWRFSPERNNPHPAPFPLTLPLRIIFSLLEKPSEGEFSKKLVLDPYCGSGTTLVAAKLIGHNFSGIDISENYLKQTQKRLDNFVEESGAWLKEKELHIVKDTFKNKKKKQKFVGNYSSQTRQKIINTETLF